MEMEVDEIKLPWLIDPRQETSFCGQEIKGYCLHSTWPDRSWTISDETRPFRLEKTGKGLTR